MTGCFSVRRQDKELVAVASSDHTAAQRRPAGAARGRRAAAGHQQGGEKWQRDTWLMVCQSPRRRSIYGRARGRCGTAILCSGFICSLLWNFGVRKRVKRTFFVRQKVLSKLDKIGYILFKSAQAILNNSKKKKNPKDNLCDSRPLIISLFFLNRPDVLLHTSLPNCFTQRLFGNYSEGRC